MAVELPILTRGIYVPDANIAWPIGDAWSPTGFVAAQGATPYYYPLASKEAIGSGRELWLDLTNTSHLNWNYYLTSALTPFGIGAGPFLFDTPASVHWWIGIVVKTVDIPADSTSIAKVKVLGYEADGTTLCNGGPELEFDGVGTRDDLQTSTTYELFTVRGSATPNADCRWYKLRVFLRRRSGGPAQPRMALIWAGMGISSGASAQDKLSSWYNANPIISMGTTRKRHSGVRTEQPYYRAQGHAVHGHNINVAFPNLSLADKEIIQAATYWNQAAPTDDIGSYSCFIANRGTPQPVIIAVRREGIKRAMYADMPAEPQLTEVTPEWMPENNGKWGTNIVFQEWL